ncbi:MAG: hypothetical protein ACTSPB_01620 [Candidatus Thorarchaeota archaeon]
MTSDATNGKILQMISMINDNQVRMDAKIDRILERTSALEADFSALPCSYMKERIDRVEEETAKNSEFRWSLKGQFALISTIAGVVSFFVAYILPRI